MFKSALIGAQCYSAHFTQQLWEKNIRDTLFLNCSSCSGFQGDLGHEARSFLDMVPVHYQDVHKKEEETNLRRSNLIWILRLKPHQAKDTSHPGNIYQSFLRQLLTGSGCQLDAHLYSIWTLGGWWTLLKGPTTAALWQPQIYHFPQCCRGMSLKLLYRKYINQQILCIVKLVA